MARENRGRHFGVTDASRITELPEARVACAEHPGELLPDAILPDSTLLAVANSDHWNFVLPFARSPRRIVQAQLASGRDFPREALLRAIVRTVTASPR